MTKRERPARVTLQQVAQHAGVSRATASLIVRGSSEISEKTRKKVLESMNELGYVYDRLAANLRSRNSSTVGLIITEIANPFYSELLVGVHEALDTNGYTVILGTTFESTEKQELLVSTMLEYRVGGVIMSPVAAESSKQTLERLRQWDIPVVFVAKEVSGASYDYVSVDNVLGAKMAVEHLIAKEHRRIAFIGGPNESTARNERIRGYCDALAEAGLEFDPSLLLESPTTRKGGLEAARRMLEHPNPPTAIFCYTDVIAFGVMQGIKEAGLTPGSDIAVVGFDNIQEAALSNPSLTTVTANPQTIGTHAASLLHQRITGLDLEPKRIILQPELVIRESCSGIQKH